MYDDYKYKNKLDEFCYKYIMPTCGIIAVLALFISIILAYKG